MNQDQLNDCLGKLEIVECMDTSIKFVETRRGPVAIAVVLGR